MSNAAFFGPTNRFSSSDERAAALRALASFGTEVRDRFARGGKIALDPLVGGDFGDLGPHRMLLLPPGVHQLTLEALQEQAQCRSEEPLYIIGLDAARTTLRLPLAPLQAVVNADTGCSTALNVLPLWGIRLAKLRLAAPCRTVLETCFVARSAVGAPVSGWGDEEGVTLPPCPTETAAHFSQIAADVDCGDAIDILNTANRRFCHGHAWALDAFGSHSYSVRSAMERSFDHFNGQIGQTIVKLQSSANTAVALTKRMNGFRIA